METKDKCIKWVNKRIETTKKEKAVLGIETPEKLKLTAGKGGKLRAFKEILAYLETH
jgi:hypothetical protein